MVTEYGMSDKLGPLTLGQKQDQVFLGRDFAANPDYSDRIASEIDAEIRRIIDDAYLEAEHIMKEHKAELDQIANKLMDVETIDGKELDALIGHPKERREKPREGSDEDTTPVKA